MVEVFKTNVEEPSQARKLVSLLRRHFPKSKVNFDLEDCDKILRVEGEKLKAEKVAGILTKQGFACILLE